jgi:hypothetical protein
VPKKYDTFMTLHCFGDVSSLNARSPGKRAGAVDTGRLGGRNGMAAYFAVSVLVVTGVRIVFVRGFDLSH